MSTNRISFTFAPAGGPALIRSGNPGGLPLRICFLQGRGMLRLASASDVQLPTRPFNAQFLRFAANHLPNRYWHAILSRVCQFTLSDSIPPFARSTRLSV